MQGAQAEKTTEGTHDCHCGRGSEIQPQNEAALGIAAVGVPAMEDCSWVPARRGPACLTVESRR